MTRDIALAKQIIRKSISIGWMKLRYEEMILVPYDDIGMSLAEALGLSINGDRQDEAAFYAARALRREFQVSNAAWAKRLSADSEVDRLIRIVEKEFEETATNRSPPRILPILRLRDDDSRVDGFVPWTSFRRWREVVPSVSGVYLIGHFDEAVETSVDPLSKHVIDIGKANRQTVRQRLSGFERVALSGRGGKSAGWPYRNDFVRDYEELINFHGLFVSWRVFPCSLQESTEQYENRLLAEYRALHSRPPAINKQQLRRTET